MSKTLKPITENLVTLDEEEDSKFFDRCLKPSQDVRIERNRDIC